MYRRIHERASSICEALKAFGRSRFPMPMFLFEKFVGKDIPTMWRWLRTNPVSLDTRQTYEIYPQAMTVRAWMRSLKENA